MGLPSSGDGANFTRFSSRRTVPRPFIAQPQKTGVTVRCAMPSLMPLSQLLFGERLLHEELFHKGFVGFGDLLIQLGHVLFDLLFGLGGQGDLLAGMTS